MLGMMRILLSFFLFLTSLQIFSADMTLSVDAHSRQFVVKLPANPTTGYLWTVKQYDKAILQLTSREYLKPQTKLIGAGGVMTFTFSRVKGAVYPTSTVLLFRYARSWEPAAAEIKKITVDFH